MDGRLRLKTVHPLEELAIRTQWALGVTAALLCLAAAPLRAGTKTVQVGPGGALMFLDEDSGTNTTTITAGDTVQWVWMSSGHSSTRTENPKTWDSDIQNAGFTFSETFSQLGTLSVSLHAAPVPRHGWHCGGRARRRRHDEHHAAATPGVYRRGSRRQRPGTG